MVRDGPHHHRRADDAEAGAPMVEHTTSSAAAKKESASGLTGSPDAAIAVDGMFFGASLRLALFLFVPLPL